MKRVSVGSVPHLVLLDRGLVAAGFALAQWANQLPCIMITTFALSDMSEFNIRNYVQYMRAHARRHEWTKNMLDIELQYFDIKRLR